MIGVNSGHGGQLDLAPATAAAWGAGCYRWPLLAGRDPLPTVRACNAAGLEPWPVLVRESFERDGRIVKDLEAWAYELGGVTTVQVCNEPDGAGESSWWMSQAELNVWLAEARRWFPRPRYRLLGPGLVSGNPDWLRGVNLGTVDALCPHPYAKWPGTPELDRLLEGYRRYGLALAVTEYDSQVPGMGEYLAGYPGVESALVFTGHRYGAWGLLDHPDALAEFKELTGASMPEKPLPWIGGGLLDMAKRRGWTPVDGERQNYPMVLTDKGAIYWSPHQQRAYAVAYDEMPAALERDDPHAAEIAESGRIGPVSPNLTAQAAEGDSEPDEAFRRAWEAVVA